MILFEIASLLIRDSVVILFVSDSRLKSLLIRDSVVNLFEIEKCFYSRLQGF